MLDHIGLTVSDYAASKRFYAQALAPLGLGLVMEIGPELTGDGTSAAGFGRADDRTGQQRDPRDMQSGEGRAFFWIGDAAYGDKTHIGHVHVAFVVEDRAAVDRFHDAALAAGGSDNGTPGLRPHYHPDYYAAFALDPDGHNVEAVCHSPETEA